MSRTGKRIINRLPEHSRVHDPDNAMHGLLNHGVGEWFDRLEELFFKVVEKRNIITNISDENDPTSDDYLLSGYFLDIQGEEYGLICQENETNTEYRNRILGILQNNITVDGIALIVASILNIPVEEVEIINNRDALRFGDKIYNRLENKKHKPLYNRLVRTRGILQIKVHEIEDVEFLKQILEECTLAFVEIILLYSKLLLAPENAFYANVGDNVDFTVILLNQDEQFLEDKIIVFHNNDSILGSRNTNEVGKATINLKNIKLGTYNLKGRYNKTYSSTHKLVVKYGLKLSLEGPTSAENGEFLRYIVTAVNQNGNLVSDLTINWFVDNELVNSCVTNDTGRCMYCFTAKKDGIHEIFVQVDKNEEYHDTLSNKVYLDVYGTEEHERIDTIVDFVLNTGRTVAELEEVKEIASGINLYGEKWIPWDFPLEDVQEYFNNDYSNIQFFIDNKRLKHLFINKAQYKFFLLEIPYYKMNQSRIPIKAVIYGNQERRFYYNSKDLSKNYYNFTNGLPNDYLGSESNFIDSDEDEIVLNMDERGVFRACPVEYRDILTVEKVKNINNSYKSLVSDENLNDNSLPNYALTTGTKDNDTGLFITPIPDSDLDINLVTNEEFTPVGSDFVLTRQLMNNKGKYVMYYANLPNMSNIAIKEGYEFYLAGWLKYIGHFNIALVIIMQNIMQVKYKTLMSDEEYEITYPQKFEHYTLEGLENINIVKQSTAPILSDISQSGGYYRSISHQKANTGYTYYTPPNSYSTTPVSPTNAMLITPGNSRDWVTPVSQLPADAYVKQFIYNLTLTADGMIGFTISSASINQGASVSGSYALTNHKVYMTPANAIHSSQLGSVNTHIYSNTTSSYTRFSNIDLTIVWETIATPYTYYTTYTNANFKSGKFKISSNTAELVIENNQQKISTLKGYLSSNNQLKGTLLTNTNIKSVAINNWDDEEYTFELAYTTPDTNLFTDLYLKNIYNNIVLEDISYELQLICKHGLDQSQINSIQATDNNNKNIYRKTLNITNFPELTNFVRTDKKNIRFVLKEEKVLLNHTITSEGFMIELPDQYLQANRNTISAVIMPLDYEYEGQLLASYLPSLYLNEVEYVLPQ